MVKNRIVLAMVCMACLYGCAPASQPAVFPGAEWEVRSPESQGVDSVKLMAALQYLASQSGENGIRETAVIRNGYLIQEGPDSRKQHATWSIGKAFTSTALGLLIEDGKCALQDVATQYEPLLSGLYRDVTLRHLTTMTSGYDGAGGNRWRKTPTDFGDWGPTPYLPVTPLFPPGGAFLVWDEAMMMFGRILTRIAGMDLKDFMTGRITGPIGMGEWDWDTEGELDGIPVRFGGGNVVISARQLARFGWLFLNRGNWNGRQLITEDWVRESTSTQVPATTPQYGAIRTTHLDHTDAHFDVEGAGVYGYNWYTNGIKADGARNLPDAPVSLYYRTGYNHNMLFVIPEWNMVIVRLGIDGSPENRLGIWNRVIGLIGESLL